MLSHSVVSDSLCLYEQQPSRLLCPWDFPGKNTGADPFPPPGDLPNPGTAPMSLVSPELAGRFFTTVSPGKPNIIICSKFTDSYIYISDFSKSVFI